MTEDVSEDLAPESKPNHDPSSEAEAGEFSIDTIAQYYKHKYNEDKRDISEILKADIYAATVYTLVKNDGVIAKFQSVMFNNRLSVRFCVPCKTNVKIDGQITTFDSETELSISVCDLYALHVMATNPVSNMEELEALDSTEMDDSE